MEKMSQMGRSMQNAEYRTQNEWWTGEKGTGQFVVPPARSTN